MRNSLVLVLLFATYFSFGQNGSEILIKANRATLERNYAEAITLYKQYINLHPEDYRGYFNLGTTQYNNKQFTASKNSFTTCLSFNPYYKEAYYHRGLCNVQLKQYNLAIKDYNFVLDKDSFNVPFLKLRAEVYTLTNENNLALKDLDQAVSVNKYSGDLYKQRAKLKVKLKDINGALHDYNSLEHLQPKYKMVHYIKGNLFLELDDEEFACEEFQKAIDNKIYVAERAYNKICVRDTTGN